MHFVNKFSSIFSTNRKVGTVSQSLDESSQKYLKRPRTHRPNEVEFHFHDPRKNINFFVAKILLPFISVYFKLELYLKAFFIHVKPYSKPLHMF